MWRPSWQPLANNAGVVSAPARIERKPPVQRNLVRPSRLAAAAALALGGLIAGPSVVPAKADCARASVWIYKSQQGRDHVYGPYQCVGPDHTLPNNLYYGWGTASDSFEPGTITGAGFEVWIP